MSADVGWREHCGTWWKTSIEHPEPCWLCGSQGEVSKAPSFNSQISTEAFPSRADRERIFNEENPWGMRV